MATSRDLLIKWTTYAVCILALLGAWALFFGRLRIWGVLPFLPPILLAVVASFEETRASAIFGLAFGAVCDLALAAPMPCLYTLSFTAAAILSSELAKSVLQPGFFCSLVVSALAFCVTDLFWAATLLLGGHASPDAVFWVFVRESAVSLLLLPLVYPLLSRLHRFLTI